MTARCLTGLDSFRISLSTTARQLMLPAAMAYSSRKLLAGLSISGH
jgi:hypothetical protein